MQKLTPQGQGAIRGNRPTSSMIGRRPLLPPPPLMPKSKFVQQNRPISRPNINVISITTPMKRRLPPPETLQQKRSSIEVIVDSEKEVPKSFRSPEHENREASEDEEKPFDESDIGLGAELEDDHPSGSERHEDTSEDASQPFSLDMESLLSQFSTQEGTDETGTSPEFLQNEEVRS